jgi:hypothetical protein
MVFDCAKRADVMEEAIANADHELAKKIDDRLGFMTPILKVGFNFFHLIFAIFAFHLAIKGISHRDWS